MKEIRLDWFRYKLKRRNRVTRSCEAIAAGIKASAVPTIALGIPVHSVLESGIVSQRILQAVSDHHADLLVLGTRAKTEAGCVALGTVARQLLAKSRCPIPTVCPDAVKLFTVG